MLIMDTVHASRRSERNDVIFQEFATYMVQMNLSMDTFFVSLQKLKLVIDYKTIYIAKQNPLSHPIYKTYETPRRNASIFIKPMW